MPQTKEARRGKTRRRHLLLNAMALGPGLVLAEVVGSAFCPLTPSRRLHCLLYRCSRPTPRTTSPRTGALSSETPRVSLAGETGFLKQTMRATRRTAQPETHREACDPRGDREATDSSTVGDTSPGDAFPASSSWFAAGSVSPRLEGRTCAKCEAEPLPRRRAWFAEGTVSRRLDAWHRLLLLLAAPVLPAGDACTLRGAARRRLWLPNRTPRLRASTVISF